MCFYGIIDAVNTNTTKRTKLLSALFISGILATASLNPANAITYGQEDLEFLGGDTAALNELEASDRSDVEAKARPMSIFERRVLPLFEDLFRYFENIKPRSAAGTSGVPETPEHKFEKPKKSTSQTKQTLGKNTKKFENKGMKTKTDARPILYLGLGIAGLIGIAHISHKRKEAKANKRKKFRYPTDREIERLR